MSSQSLEIRPFEIDRATEAEFAAWTEVSNRMRAEAWPDDPQQSVEKLTREMRNLPAHLDVWRWAVCKPDGGYAATAGVRVWRTGHNEHACSFHVSVLPEFRRRGWGTRLLRNVVETAAANDRRLLFFNSVDAVPEGGGFARVVGARFGQSERISQLDLREVDRDLIRRWRERAQERAAGYRLGLWEGAYPEEALEEVAAMREAENLMPRGDFDAEDERITPERLRDEDASMVARGYGRWSMYVRDPETGRIAGWTELFWDPDEPQIVHQGGTAVFQEHQGRGLGRWLKAAMLEKLLKERPAARWVRTGNATTNRPMLNINEELGFKPYRHCLGWQLDVPVARAYLEGRGV